MRYRLSHGEDACRAGGAALVTLCCFKDVFFALVVIVERVFAVFFSPYRELPRFDVVCFAAADRGKTYGRPPDIARRCGFSRQQVKAVIRVARMNYRIFAVDV